MIVFPYAKYLKVSNIVSGGEFIVLNSTLMSIFNKNMIIFQINNLLTNVGDYRQNYYTFKYY